MKRTLIILLVLFRVCGYSQDIELLNVELNTPSSSEIGEAIVTAGELLKYDGLKIKESFSVKSGFITYQHSKGANYPFVSIKKGYRIYYPKNNYKDGRYWGIGVNIDNPDIKVPVLVSMVGLVSKMKKYEINNKVEELELTELCENVIDKNLSIMVKLGM